MQKIRFGELELKALFALEEEEAGVVTLAELIKKLRLSRVQAWKLASRLVRKKRLIRLKNGVYLFAPMKAGREGLWSENALASIPKLVEEKTRENYYVSFWAALNHYGLTEQIPFTAQIVSTRKQRPFKALQTRFEFVQVHRLGEWHEEEVGGKKLKFATVEQLLLDCLAFPEHCGGVKEACKALWNARKKIDWVKLGELASKSSGAVQRRLGYLTELLDLRGNLKKQGKQKRVFVGWRWLDPSNSKKTFEKSIEWGLLLNVSEKELTEWKEH